MSEKTIAECRPHWSGFIIQGVLGALFVVVGIIGFVSGNIEAGILLVVLALPFIAYILISRKFTYIRLTETKVEGHIGFIKSKTLSTPISKIQGISLSNGLLGKIFRYHTVVITSAGTGETEYAFKHMAHAKEFANAVESQAVTPK